MLPWRWQLIASYVLEESMPLETLLLTVIEFHPSPFPLIPNQEYPYLLTLLLLFRDDDYFFYY